MTTGILGAVIEKQSCEGACGPLLRAKAELDLNFSERSHQG
jgi:hypothetical protein